MTAKEVFLMLDGYKTFYFTLQIFEVRASHLFKYDFTCTEYKSLLNCASEVTKSINEIMSIAAKGGDLDSHKMTASFDQFHLLLNKVLNDLRHEVIIYEKQSTRVEF
jgi:hypothetical protein